MRAPHTDREYEAELALLRQRVRAMGAIVREMLVGGVRALVDGDTVRAQAVIDRDEEIDRLEVELDEQCLRVLARRQPVASDLRLIAATLKLVTDLERMGDLCGSLCERVIELAAAAPQTPAGSLPLMAAAVEAMVLDAIEAFVTGDAGLAEQVLTRDDLVDSYFAQLLGELFADMMAQPAAIYRATRLTSVAKYLERIADHATNVAELAVFMVNGEDIRHRHRSRAPRI
ncbi:MAG: phosphate signaling complex protein PhoU [Deltaproteobacteria bacterium]|nr:phosphate signaling complex protein PhoU [Deltaproteobacteria bacterium]